MSLPSLDKPTTYTIDPNHSTVRFSVRHLMISKIHGEMDAVSGTVTADAAAKTLLIDATIQVSSLTTKQDQRDAHVKSADFLDAEKFPTITFKSTSAKQTGAETFEIVGDLTMHGVTKPVTLEAEATDEIASPFGGYKIGVTAKAKLDREDFGVNWNQALETGGVMVGKEISVEIDLELDRPA